MVVNSIVVATMLCYPMLWYGMESMVCYEISMLCYEISMLCYAMVYVVKDKHSATVRHNVDFCQNVVYGLSIPVTAFKTAYKSFHFVKEIKGYN